MKTPPDQRAEADKLLRFILIGGGFSLFYAVASATLVNVFAAPPRATSILLYVLCIPAAFWMQKTFAFRTRNLRRGALIYYVVTQVFAITLVSSGTIWLVRHVWWWDTLVFGLIVSLTALLNYLVGRFFTFRESA